MSALLVCGILVGADHTGGRSLDKDSTLVRIPLEHSDALNVHAVVQIGSAAATVVVDTGSSQIWVASSDCEKRSRQNDIEHFRVRYGSGDVTGRVIHDTLHFSGMLTIESLRMGCVERGSAPPIGADGVVGLGMEGLQHDTNSSDLLSMIRQTIAPSQLLMFSIFISPDPTNHHYPPSQLIIGGVDEVLVGSEIEWHVFPVVPDTRTGRFGFWEIDVRAATLGTRSLTASLTAHPTAILDSGSSLILFPKPVFLQVVEELSQAVGQRFKCSQQTSAAFTTFDCVCRECNPTMFPSLVFEFGDDLKSQHFELKGVDYVWCGQHRRGQCVLLLDVVEDMQNGRVVLGTVFLRTFYTAFDFSTKQVSIACPQCRGGENPPLPARHATALLDLHVVGRIVILVVVMISSVVVIHRYL